MAKIKRHKATPNSGEHERQSSYSPLVLLQTEHLVCKPLPTRIMCAPTWEQASLLLYSRYLPNVYMNVYKIFLHEKANELPQKKQMSYPTPVEWHQIAGCPSNATSSAGHHRGSACDKWWPGVNLLRENRQTPEAMYMWLLLCGLLQKPELAVKSRSVADGNWRRRGASKAVPRPLQVEDSIAPRAHDSA